MKVEINSEIFNKYGNIYVGAITARGVISQSLINAAYEEKEDAVKVFKERLQHYGSIDNIECIKNWREIYGIMGAKKTKISSIENIYKFILEKDRLFDVNPIVDIYNSISCKFGLPMAGYDIDNIAGSTIILREAKKGEAFIPLGLNQTEKTKNGEVIYCDTEKIICRYWNNKDSDLTKIKEDTKNVIFIFDCPKEKQINDLEDAVNRLAEILKSNISDLIIKSGFLDKNNFILEL